MSITFEEAYKILEQEQISQGNKYYEIAEDSYVYPNGVVLIVYADPEHEAELYHVTYDLDNWRY